VVLVTGGSSGIGLAAAIKFAEAGAITVICARDEASWPRPRARSSAGRQGRDVVTFSADIADEASCKALVDWLTRTYGGVDFLINNAGRSIRRAIESELRPLPRLRAHDAAQLLRLPARDDGPAARHGREEEGHIVNISSIGVLTNAPRFSAYVASKAALDAWTRCASSEYADQGITFTTINMPLVRTPMIAPTKIYNNVPTLEPEEAADMIATACVYKPVRIATRLGISGEVLHALLPRVAQIVMNTTFRMFPDSSAAKGDKSGKPTLSPEAMAMQQMMRGIHF
jgi:NAD(P)-dependent dehydrogenase (short-subunit alcohol dehydrogenase family)